MGQFSNFVSYVENLDIDNCDLHLKLQSRLIDMNHIDYLGRMETFEYDFKKVLNVLNISFHEIGQLNSSKNREGYQKYYNDKLAQQVYNIYRKDIQIFGYRY